MSSPITKLSVNVNKIAVLRNSRGDSLPSPLDFARRCLLAGADGITVHPRPDERHIRSSDVYELAGLCREFGVEFNIEGNPFAPARGNYPGLLALCAATSPAQVTLVPDADGQITSDHGFDFVTDERTLRDVIPSFAELGARVSVFADAETPDFALARTVGADRVELYTGPYAEAFDLGGPALVDAVGRFADAARRAQAAGLEVNAGHDLSQYNLAYFLQHVPNVAEVSIGHALVAECLIDGLEVTLSRYRAALR